jgi:hypothetical protein
VNLISQPGFFAQYRIELDGVLSPRMWKDFKKKVLPHHAYSWKVTKTTQKWGGPRTIVTFRLKDPERVLARVDWEFLKAALCLLVKPA